MVFLVCFKVRNLSPCKPKDCIDIDATAFNVYFNFYFAFSIRPSVIPSTPETQACRSYRRGVFWFYRFTCAAGFGVAASLIVMLIFIFFWECFGFGTLNGHLLSFLLYSFISSLEMCCWNASLMFLFSVSAPNTIVCWEMLGYWPKKKKISSLLILIL